MPTTRPAQTDKYAKFFRPLQDQSAEYLDQSVADTQLCLSEFIHLFQTTGQVHAIQDAGQAAGNYWIEQRKRKLHPHALILEPQFQVRGIDSWVLQKLEQDFAGQIDLIELGVQQANISATQLYERYGYKTV